ncbi:protein-disulfide reductase DsbD N-terminal domain-containing protein [Cupriavidus necator]
MNSLDLRRRVRMLPRHAMLCIASLVLFALPALAQTTSLLEKLTGKTAEPVSPDQAFSVTARRVNASRIALDFSVRPGYYLYKERLFVALKGTPGVRIARVDYPPTVTKQDQTFGRSEVYTKPFVLTLQLEGASHEPVTVVARYQGCYEAMGVCYPPETKTVGVTAAGAVTDSRISGHSKPPPSGRTASP